MSKTRVELVVAPGVYVDFELDELGWEETTNESGRHIRLRLLPTKVSWAAVEGAIIARYVQDAIRNAPLKGPGRG